ncbi:lantibiotic dehydratase [Catenulispora sp. NF23]|uniref:lantibiotic dehydratase n=1 Tax=Catenulispora pinistramenti TaxID=2705254 RepID=UPI001BA54503|nr:lantibiotic dehydratase [Catenulispora pinistramenti]MBS2534412.1 lantibiotic dehydratase [Catenulispora pinistramenti]
MSLHVDRHPDQGIGVRVAGLPADALDASRLVRSTEIAVGIVRLDRDVEEDAAVISAELHQLIGDPGARAQALKPSLVGLRRAVHRGIRIRALLDTTGVPEVLGPRLAERIEQHLKLRDERTEAFHELERVRADELSQAAVALADLLHDEDFAFGVSYASPDLYEDSNRWAGRLREDSGRRELDKAGVRLAKYAARAMAKPSPLSTFAASGLGRWSAAQEPGTGSRPAAWLEPTQRGHTVELSLLPLSRIAAALAHLPDFDAVARLRVNPFTATESVAGGDRLLFTAPGPAGSVRSLALNESLAALLHAARSARTPADLSSTLREAAGQANPEDAASATIHPLVAQLISAGLLERLLPVPDQELDAATLAAWLDENSPVDGRSERLAGVLDALHAIAADLEHYPRTAPAEHRPIARRLHRNTASAARRLGLIASDDELDPRATFFHNSVLSSDAAVLDQSAWQDVVTHLSLVPGLLAPFDTLTPRRTALYERAVTESGAGFRQPLVSFVRDFGSWWEEQDSYEPIPRDAERQAAVLRLVERGRLDPESVRDLTADWIEPPASHDRYTCYVQAFPDGEGRIGAVLNTLACGRGIWRARTNRLLQVAQLGGSHDDLDEPAAGPLYAELDGGFASTLNQRTPELRYAIDLAASWSGRDRRHRINPDDLMVTADPAGQRLRLESRSSGREVRPMHLGLLATPLLPMPARLLVEAFGQSSYSFWSDWPQFWPAQAALTAQFTTAAPGAPSRLPRVTLGSVVLRRAAWFLPPGTAPTPDPARSDASFLVQLHDWRERHAVPMRCFLRVLTVRTPGALPGATVQDKDRKPLYVDFSHRHLVRVFENAAASGRPLLLTEALPDLADAPAYPSGSRHAAEFVLEVGSSLEGA